MSDDDLSKHYVTGIKRLLYRFKAWRYRRKQTRLAMRFPIIGPTLLAQLYKVVPSRDWALEYRPCRVRLVESGEWRDRVYLVEALAYSRSWGFDMEGREYLPLPHIDVIESSPSRLPPHLANKLYAGGESGMGYFVFTLVARSGQSIPCIAGNAVDWIQLPDAVVPHDLVDVLPHEGLQRFRGDPHAEREYAHAAEFAWCLYRLDK